MSLIIKPYYNATEKFRELAETLSRLAEREGISVSPYGPDGPIHFGKLSPEAQTDTVGNFARFVKVCNEVSSSGHSLTDDPHVLWRMFHELGVHPVRDLMSAIGSTDMVEIYSSSLIQVFRNLRFFSVCSYTLDELLCRPFYELFRRDEALTQRLMGIVQDVLEGERTGVHPWNVGNHTVDEIASPARYHAIVHYKIISPLYDASGRVACFINTFETLSIESRIP